MPPMTLSRRTLLAAAAAATLIRPGLAPAQKKLVRMVVPFAPGTTPDLIARAIGPAMQTRLDAGYVVDNKVGASGMIGMDFVAKSADSATLLIVPSTTVTLPLFYKNIEFDVLNGFTPITQVSSSSFVLGVHADVPARNFAEFVSWARNTRGIFYASPGNGTHHHLCMELLQQVAGVKIEHVPYKGAAQAFTDLLGGQVQAMFMPIQVGVQHQRAGRVKIIGGSLRERHPGFPDIPTLQEQGARGFEVDPWFAVWGPPRLGDALVEQYRAAIVAALDDAAVKEGLIKQGQIIKWGAPAELLALARAESALWARVLRQA